MNKCKHGTCAILEMKKNDMVNEDPRGCENECYFNTVRGRQIYGWYLENYPEEMSLCKRTGMQVIIYDDKKEKRQSWEAKIHLPPMSEVNGTTIEINHLIGYGVDKNEAIGDLIGKVDNTIERLETLIDDLRNINYKETGSE